MNEMALVLYDVEKAMKRAIGSGLLVFGIVFIAGVLFGWSYAMLIAFVIAFLVTLVGRR